MTAAQTSTAASHEATVAVPCSLQHSLADNTSVVVWDEAYLGRYCTATSPLGSSPTAMCRFLQSVVRMKGRGSDCLDPARSERIREVDGASDPTYPIGKVSSAICTYFMQLVSPQSLALAEIEKSLVRLTSLSIGRSLFRKLFHDCPQTKAVVRVRYSKGLDRYQSASQSRSQPPRALDPNVGLAPHAQDTLLF